MIVRLEALFRAAPPELNVTTGREIESLATIESVTTRPVFACVDPADACVVGELFVDSATVVNIGAVLSNLTVLESVTLGSGLPTFPEAS